MPAVMAAGALVAVMSASNASRLAQGEAQMRTYCAATMPSYSHQEATVDMMRAYARCVDLLYPSAAAGPGHANLVIVCGTVLGLVLGASFLPRALGCDDTEVLDRMLGGALGTMFGVLFSGLLIAFLSAV